MVVKRPARAGSSSSVVREAWDGLLREVVLDKLNSSLLAAASGTARPTQTCIPDRRSADDSFTEVPNGVLQMQMGSDTAKDFRMINQSISNPKLQSESTRCPMLDAPDKLSASHRMALETGHDRRDPRWVRVITRTSRRRRGGCKRGKALLQVYMGTGERRKMNGQCLESFPSCRFQDMHGKDRPDVGAGQAWKRKQQGARSRCR